jgi:XapX domain-containing protein
MVGYLVSLVMGLAVGVAYGLVQVRSPPPPADRAHRFVGHGAGGASD